MRRTDNKTHRMYPIGKTFRRLAINGLYEDDLPIFPGSIDSNSGVFVFDLAEAIKRAPLLSKFSVALATIDDEVVGLQVNSKTQSVVETDYFESTYSEGIITIRVKEGITVYIEKLYNEAYTTWVPAN